jgi:hypothetical protein
MGFRIGWRECWDAMLVSGHCSAWAHDRGLARKAGRRPLYEAGIVKWAQSFSMQVFRTFAADMRLGQLSIQAVAESEAVLLV